MKKIGLLGGSFDPPHKGHIFISIEAKKMLKLDEVWWLITPQNPLKISKPATYSQRVYNCRKITKTFPIKIIEIEKKIGRVRSGKVWESRVIDIDVLLYGNRNIQEEGLTIPHYDLSNRDFFLIPLLELNPDLLNPRTNKSLVQELKEIPQLIRTIDSSKMYPCYVENF